MTPGHDDEHDAWLREALRHAPDAQLGAPPSLGERILREAQAKARTGAAATPRGAIARGWAWLARPPVSAGFAGVMVATMVGLLWWDRSPPPMPPATTSQTAPPMAPPPAPAMPADTAQTPAAPSTAAPARSESRPLAADAPEVASKRRARETAPSAGTAAATADAAAKAMAPAPAAERQVGEPATAQTDPSLRSFARGAPAAVSLAPRDAGLAALRASLADDATRWSWQRPPSSPQPMTEPLQAWFAQLEAVTAGRFEPDTRDLAAAAPDLRLLHDGRIQHRFGFDRNTFWWETTAEPAAPLRQRATLDTSQADALRTALERAAR